MLFGIPPKYMTVLGKEYVTMQKFNLQPDVNQQGAVFHNIVGLGAEEK